MKGFILAGGKGTRLYPVTYETPKPLLTVGKVPVINYLVNLYLKNDINDIKINIAEKDLDLFLKWKNDYFQNVKISFLIEKKQTGTLGPLIQSANWIDSDIIVSNGDEIKETPIKNVLEFHKKKKSTATIVLTKSKNPSDYGVAVLKDQKIIDFLEKPKNPPSNYINSGLYILSTKVKNYFPQKKFAMIEKDIFPILSKKKLLYGYKTDTLWQDIGTFERWEEAMKKIKKRQ